ncbi:MAG: hypothetical protein JXQ65_14365 [Candidatus Marinimicrobia bacterium]|nr:hypothetical protein [Candidatus Neomarinimicrobiota bacterium]
MKKKYFIIQGFLQSFVALGAIPSGVLFLLAPDGSKIGLSLDILHNSPFTDFFIPGLFLLMVNGLFNLAGAFLSFFKSKYCGFGGIGLGIFLIIWILIQVYYIGLTHFFQPLFLVIGGVEFFLGYKIHHFNKGSDK